MTPQEIFNQTLEKAKAAFYEKNFYRKNLGLSICATPIQLCKTLLMGINWGGGSLSDPFPYTIQETIPSFDKFIKLYNKGEYRFLRRIEPFAKKYCQIEISTAKFNYSNLCFFRTPNINDLTKQDFVACAGIFKTMVKNINPEKIISLGTGNIKYLKENFKNEFECIENKTLQTVTFHKIYLGNLFGFKLYNLPHPSAFHLSNDVYEKLWQALFEN